jgi:V8-like Glu-specific endopeptidase
MKLLKRTRTVAAIAAASMGLLFLAVGSAGGAAAGAASPPAPGVIGGRAPTAADLPAVQRATLAYWTPARLKAAKPISVVATGTAAPLATRQGPTGKPGTSPGGLPPGATTATGGLSPQTEASPYDSFQVGTTDTTKFPYDLNGKLFLTNDGSNYVCSATSVGSFDASTAENEIWTAGHCAVNTEANNQVADSSAEFVPAYNGQYCCSEASAAAEKKWAPFGIFTWTGGWETNTAWYDNRDLSEDEAAMEVGTSNLTGATLGNSVGWDGFAWNEPVDEQFVTFGYPAAAPYAGNHMQADIAATGGQDSNGGANSENPIFIGSPFTGGSSGGAWNIDWSDTGPGYLNGHNDYVYVNSSGKESPADQMYSPYQDTLSNEVRCFGATSC